MPSYCRSAEGDGRGGWILLVDAAPDLDAARARALGGRHQWWLLGFGDWVFRPRSREDLAWVLTGLRDLGVALARVGHGWYPGDIFEQLRDEGLVTGAYQAIQFGGAGVQVTQR